MAELLQAATQPAIACLSDEEIVSFALGQLSTARLPAAHEHLDICEICQRLLSEAAHVLGAAPTSPYADDEDLDWNTTFRPGEIVGKRYRISHFIARGGMGEVYEAFDDDLQQRVALKTVTSTASDSSNAVRRLKAEVQLARRVSHPNVCRIYDFGTHTVAQTGSQISFLTMEFVDGETLGQRVRLGGALSMTEARRLARQLLLGLSAAHDAGVLHRDFKSDNVMLRTESDNRVSPLILDFGLARALDHQSQDGASTSHPSLVGTFDYIAPEQLEGKPHTTASDVYSFGVVWFEMLTGELPFETSSIPAVNALQRLHKAVAAPSIKNPLVPSGIDAMVLRCLRRAPKDRFRTAGEVLEALDAFNEKNRPIWRRGPWLALGIAACTFGIWGYSGTRKRPPDPKKEPVMRAILAAASPAPSHAAPFAPNLGPGTSVDPSTRAVPSTEAQNAVTRGGHNGSPAHTVAHSIAIATHAAAGGSSVAASVAQKAEATSPNSSPGEEALAPKDNTDPQEPSAPTPSRQVPAGWEDPFGIGASGGRSNGKTP